MDSGQYLVQEDVINRLRLTYSNVAQTRPGPKLLIYLWPTTQMRPACIFISNSLHLYSAFLGTQSALHRRGGISSSTYSVQHPPEWRDGSHSAPERSPHTSYRWRRDRVMKSIGVWGWLGGHDGQRPVVGIWPGHRGYTPTLFRRTSWDF